MLSTYSSSTRYGGAPKEVFKATLTEGTALAPSTKPKTTAALLANLAVVFAMVYQAPSIYIDMWRIETLRNIKVEARTWETRAMTKRRRVCFNQPVVRLHANADLKKWIAVSTHLLLSTFYHGLPTNIDQYKCICAVLTLASWNGVHIHMSIRRRLRTTRWKQLDWPLGHVNVRHSMPTNQLNDIILYQSIHYEVVSLKKDATSCTTPSMWQFLASSCAGRLSLIHPGNFV